MIANRDYFLGDIFKVVNGSIENVTNLNETDFYVVTENVKKGGNIKSYCSTHVPPIYNIDDTKYGLI